MERSHGTRYGAHGERPGADFRHSEEIGFRRARRVGACLLKRFKAATAGDATMVAARDRNKGGGAGGGEPVRASAVMEGRGISGRFLSTADFLTF